MIALEDWAEIRRLHRAEGVPIKEIARRLGVARNTVRSALRAQAPPSRERGPRGSLVDDVEPQIRALLAEFPRMPATVIAERIGWTKSLTILKDRVRELRPLFVPPDPTDRVEYDPGEVAQCDLWFPPQPIPVGGGAERILPVLAMTCGYSRVTDAVMIPSRKAGDILAGMWEIVAGWGACPRTLVWDREAAIGGTGKLTTEAASFAGTIGVRIRLAPRRDPEFKGLVERRNGFFETSFLPGRVFTSPFDFNVQISDWLVQRANTRVLRAIGSMTPTARWAADRAAMVALPPVAPAIGLTHRVRLGRDYYVRIDGNDYSVDPRCIGRFVDVLATPSRMVASCAGQVVADHDRDWGHARTITDPEHQATARLLRQDLAARRRQASTRLHADGHVVAIRALPDYDALFGVDFDPRPNLEAVQESAAGGT
ncbi:IS21 family transposase [Micromonospora sp. WMMD987]|uniref:IS21 family transposase n=1 Tax=Micromonospora sp. WMMD987 TaxID=3016089 RepID=UPI00249A2F60|nr:IS21 family transposase [Micromonospora sp. WMMD987]WFE93541.1 IS21 family transposase [Micromonospora sp. WMMD987]WFE94134.1 IS21 family transposase [Micromonospora sp. WMMD987]WFE96609.1 IS21 family transposase [Micromonospora sp. WMMD987]